MKIIKYVMVIICAFLLCIFNAMASCTETEISNLKTKANNVKITYEQKEEYFAIDYETTDSYIRYDNYDVTISNFTEEFYILLNDYSYKNTADIADENHAFTYNVIAGSYTYHIYSSSCDVLLKDIKIYLPLNNYYNHKEECQGINTSLFKECEKWVSEEDYDYYVNLTYEDFTEKLDEYNNNNIFNKVWNFILNNKKIVAIVLGSVLLVAIVAIIIIINKKRGRLE